MKAIVLTYERYHPIADHMMCCYNQLWPNNPFKFVIPYQKNPNYLETKYKDKVLLIKTNKGIKETVLTLLEDLNNEEWVLWCMDDRYPISLNINAIEKIYSLIRTSRFDGISFTLSLKDKSIKYSNVFKNVEDNNGISYYKKKHFGSFWSHQFFKVKVIRYFFENMPDNINNAKEMDHYLLNKSVLPKSFYLTVLKKSLGNYGESSSRGKLTKNCYESMLNHKITIPQGIEITEERIIKNADDYIKHPMVWRLKDIIKTIIKQ